MTVTAYDELRDCYNTRTPDIASYHAPIPEVRALRMRPSVIWLVLCFVSKDFDANANLFQKRTAVFVGQKPEKPYRGLQQDFSVPVLQVRACQEIRTDHL